VGLPIIGTFLIVATIYLIKVGDKGTNKRREYKINLNLFLFLSGSTLFKGTNKRAKYQRKTCFSLYSRAEVP